MSKAPIAVRMPARTINVGGRQGRGDPPAARALRTFRIECLAAGAPFNWQGQATNEGDAFRQAAEAMAAELPWVHAREVRQVACIEVTRPELATFGEQLQRGE